MSHGIRRFGGGTNMHSNAGTYLNIKKKLAISVCMCIKWNISA
jgi:hypothetical protein